MLENSFRLPKWSEDLPFSWYVSRPLFDSATNKAQDADQEREDPQITEGTLMHSPASQGQNNDTAIPEEMLQAGSTGVRRCSFPRLLHSRRMDSDGAPSGYFGPCGIRERAVTARVAARVVYPQLAACRRQQSCRRMPSGSEHFEAVAQGRSRGGCHDGTRNMPGFICDPIVHGNRSNAC